MKNILFLSAGRRVELISAFRTEIISKKLPIKILATDLKTQLSAACQIADVHIKAPNVTDPIYPDFLFEVCTLHEIGLVIPTIDTELLLLSTIRKKFLEKGIHIIISDESLIRICRDKRLSSIFFQDIGIDVPTIYPIDKITFPCFVKPYDGSCSSGVNLVQHENELTKAMLNDEKMIFMEFIDNSYEEYTVDAYYNQESKLKCLVPRQRIEVRGGEVNKGITKRHFLYNHLLPKLRSLPGARGCLTFQFFVNEQTEHIVSIEINPRFGGGFPLTYSAGANYPGWLIDEYLLGKDVPFFDAWENNLLMLRYDAKVLVHDVFCS